MARIATKEKQTSSKSLRTKFVAMFSSVGVIGVVLVALIKAVSFSEGSKPSDGTTLDALKIKAKAKVTCIIRSYILQYLA